MRAATVLFLLTLASSAAAQTVSKPDGAWRGALGASLTSSSGNNESTSASLNADAVRQRAHDKLVASVLSLYSRSETDGVEELAHPLPVQNVFRGDEPAPSLPVDAALANAPSRRGDFFGVPAVLETGTEG